MDEYYNQPEQTTEPPQEEPLSLSDKVVGILSEPVNTFSVIARQPVKTSHWLLLLTFVIFIQMISSVLISLNPDIRTLIKEKFDQRIEKISGKLDDEVQKGRMTKEQKEQQIQAMEKQRDAIGTPIALVFQLIGTVIFIILAFFVVTGYYFFIMKFFFATDDLNYPQVLQVDALTGIISIIEIIISTAVILLSHKIISGLSVASLISYEKNDFLGFIFTRLNPFSIWLFSLYSIGLAKISRSENTMKYVYLVFGSWLGWSLLWFAAMKFIPFLAMWTD